MVYIYIAYTYTQLISTKAAYISTLKYIKKQDLYKLEVYYIFIYNSYINMYKNDFYITQTQYLISKNNIQFRMRVTNQSTKSQLTVAPPSWFDSSNARWTWRYDTT